MKKSRILKSLTATLVLGIILSCCGCASEEARMVKQQIKNIGTVTLESGNSIIVAEASYAALSEKDKKSVSNYDDLLEAKAAYEDLVNRKTFIELTDTIKQNIIGKHNLESSFESDYDTKTAVCNFFTDTTVEDVREDAKYNRISLYNAVLETYTETIDDILSTYRNNQLMGVNVTVNVYLDDKETLLLSINGNSKDATVNLFQTLYDEKVASIQNRDNCVFRNIKWGDTYETVLANETAEVLVDEEDGLMFDIDFANWDSDYVCWFDDSKVLTSFAVAATEDFYGDDCFSCFNAYRDELTAIYGTPHTDKRVVTSSLANYTDEIGALQLGYAKYITQWKSENADIGLAMYAKDFNDIIVFCRFYPKTT